MNEIHQSILEKLTALNIDIYHYEELLYPCYQFDKLEFEGGVRTWEAVNKKGSRMRPFLLY